MSISQVIPQLDFGGSIVSHCAFSIFCTGKRSSSVMELGIVGLMAWRITQTHWWEFLPAFLLTRSLPLPGQCGKHLYRVATFYRFLTQCWQMQASFTQRTPQQRKKHTIIGQSSSVSSPRCVLTRFLLLSLVAVATSLSLHLFWLLWNQSERCKVNSSRGAKRGMQHCKSCRMGCVLVEESRSVWQSSSRDSCSSIWRCPGCKEDHFIWNLSSETGSREG